MLIRHNTDQDKTLCKTANSEVHTSKQHATWQTNASASSLAQTSPGSDCATVFEAVGFLEIAD
jgi:hypothetical protein